MENQKKSELEAILKGFKLCEQYGYKIAVKVKDQVKNDYVKIVEQDL